MITACSSLTFVDSGLIQNRVEENAQLQRELRRTRRRLQDEDRKIASFKHTLKSSASTLARLLLVRTYLILLLILNYTFIMFLRGHMARDLETGPQVPPRIFPRLATNH